MLIDRIKDGFETAFIDKNEGVKFSVSMGKNLL